MAGSKVTSLTERRVAKEGTQKTKERIVNLLLEICRLHAMTQGETSANMLVHCRVVEPKLRGIALEFENVMYKHHANELGESDMRLVGDSLWAR